jgi:hypothetical protein
MDVGAWRALVLFACFDDDDDDDNNKNNRNSTNISDKVVVIVIRPYISSSCPYWIRADLTGLDSVGVHPA